GVEGERAAVRHPRLHDDVRPDGVDRLLEPEDVLRMLDERAAEPGEGVRVLQRPPHAEPEAGEDGEGLGWIEVELTAILEDEAGALVVDHGPGHRGSGREGRRAS